MVEIDVDFVILLISLGECDVISVCLNKDNGGIEVMMNVFELLYLVEIDLFWLLWLV